jgi:hypothetical protein
VGLNSAEGMDVHILCCVLCRWQPLEQADCSFRGVLPDVCELGTSTMRWHHSTRKCTGLHMHSKSDAPCGW